MAGLPAGKTFDSWSKQKSSIAPASQVALRTLEWVGRAENLAICGPSGTGKSHSCEAIAHAVIDAGIRVTWFEPRVADRHTVEGENRRFCQPGRDPHLPG